MTRDDPELGLVRFCKGCREWWPYDGEFWHMKGLGLHPAWLPRCVACCAEYSAERRRMRQTIERTNRVRPLPIPGRCNAPMRTGRCGRRAGHDYEHRSTVAMRADADASRKWKASA